MDWTQYCPLEYTTSLWPPIKYCTTDHHHNGLAILSVFISFQGLFFQTVHQQLIYKAVNVLLKYR